MSDQSHAVENEIQTKCDSCCKKLTFVRDDRISYSLHSIRDGQFSVSASRICTSVTTERSNVFFRP